MTGKHVNTTYVKELTPAQAGRLHDILDARGWDIDTIPHARWRARRDKTVVTVYLSGKLTVQGQGAGDFILFTLEPEVLHEAGYGYEPGSAEAPPQPDSLHGFTPHAGIDESGKGDYFGPLVIAAVFVPDSIAAQRLLDIGVRDSKQIKNDRRIVEIASRIPGAVGGMKATVIIGPEAYNRIYRNFGNLNRLLAWGHARALENLLEKAPDCREALADKFADERLIVNALQEKGRKITLTQRTKAESDIAVAAASIMARAGFVNYIQGMSDKLGRTIPKGAGPAVTEAARELVARDGASSLEKLVKIHFQTTGKVLEGS